MRLDLGEHVVRVTLSERNLLTLLVKLHQPWSARTIFGRYPCVGQEHREDLLLVVHAQSDAAHYAEREPPGAMHPATEAIVASLRDKPTSGSNGRQAP